jgi:hypothetical protein
MRRSFRDATVNDYPIEGDSSLGLLETSCDALATSRKCRAQIAQDRLIITDHRGRARAHPPLRELGVGAHFVLLGDKKPANDLRDGK